jgi:hypothetical protein
MLTLFECVTPLEIYLKITLQYNKKIKLDVIYLPPSLHARTHAQTHTHTSPPSLPALFHALFLITNRFSSTSLVMASLRKLFSVGIPPSCASYLFKRRYKEAKGRGETNEKQTRKKREKRNEKNEKNEK